VIRIFDVESGRSKTLNLGLRVFAPAFSDDASHVVAVHSDSLDRYSLLIIDVEGGKVTNKFPSPQNAFPLTPVWVGEEHIITVLVSEAGKSIAKINVETGETSYLTEWDYADISQPVYHPPYVYFTAPYSGISNIYALSLEDGGIRKVTFSQYGAVDPFISEDGESLLYTDYSADGSHIVNWPLKGGSRTPLEKVFDKSIGLYRTLEEQEEIVPDWSDVPESKAPSKKYSKLANLFNFHSWAPLAIDATNYTVNPGVSIMSQNLLSSSFFSAGYQYNLNEEAGKVYASYSYQGWYPIIDVYVDYGLRKDFVTHPIETEIKWNETNISTGLRLPLNLRRGKYYAGITPSVYINQIFRKMKPGSLLEFRKANIASGSYGVRLYRQIKSSVRDIYPQWGQSIDFYYYDTPFESDIYSSLLAAITSLYFPGIINHHGINLYGGYQYRLIGDYKFSDRVSYPRGITGKQDEQLYSFRGTYAFPIAYPDWSIGPVIYMKRIRGALFYDYAVGENPGHTNYYNSMGADLITEVHLLRFLAPFEFGVRSIYLPDENSVVWEFLFGVGF